MPSHARVIPSIEQLRQREAVQRLEARYGREATLAAIRHETAALRERLTGGSGGASHDEPADGATGQATGGSAGWASDAPTDPEAAAAVILARLEPRLRAAVAPSLRSVVNATGVIVHTNLGRAPLAGAALERIAEVAAGYANLEYDVAAGTRGSRTVHAATLLTQLTGAEAAVVVNNNAAAVLLVLAALADGREVIISRGELVEIGGGFRIPDVMRQSGAILREVGTTNRTRAADYAAAIGERTALMLRVHPSNFRIEGFTERPALAEVAALGARFDIPVVEDLGSGQLSVGAAAGAVSGRAGAGAIGDEPTVDASIDAGVSVCTFSGDKLLGGPQAGIIVGRRALLERVRRHPLMRALRVDKLTIAALEATLIEHAAGRADQTVPVARMIAAPVKELAARAEALRARLDAAAGLRVADTAGLRVADTAGLHVADTAGLHVTVEASEATIGGGSTPGITLESRALSVAVAGRSANNLASALRTNDPPVIGRIADDTLWLDLRTVPPEQDDTLAAALIRLAKE